jgi:predicted dehydrogenase
MIAHNQRFVRSHQKAKELILKEQSEKYIASVRHLVMVDQKAGVLTAKKLMVL